MLKAIAVAIIVASIFTLLTHNWSSSQTVIVRKSGAAVIDDIRKEITPPPFEVGV